MGKTIVLSGGVHGNSTSKINRGSIAGGVTPFANGVPSIGERLAGSVSMANYRQGGSKALRAGSDYHDFNGVDIKVSA